MIEFSTYVMCQELTAKEAKQHFHVNIIRSTSMGKKDRPELEIIEEKVEKISFFGHLGEWKTSCKGPSCTTTLCACGSQEYHGVNGFWTCCHTNDPEPASKCPEEN